MAVTEKAQFHGFFGVFWFGHSFKSENPMLCFYLFLAIISIGF